MSENEDALEMKSFYLANKVKIAFLKKHPNINLKLVEENAKESIIIAEKLKNCNEKPWFKEIIQLNKEILKTLNQKIKIDIRKILAEAFSKGNENLIKYLLKNYPYDKKEFSEDMIDEYKQNKKGFLFKIYKKYEEYFSDKEYSSPLKDVILEYINKMITLDNIKK